MRAGGIALVGGLMLAFAPLLLGRGTLNKYIVVAGLLCACLGMSLLLNGLLDNFFGRK
jgi:hypothetical protein